MALFDYRISTGATAIGGSGTFASTLGGLNILGTSTAFTTQVASGDMLFLSTGDPIGAVDFVTDNAHLTLKNGAQIGVSGQQPYFDAMVNIETVFDGDILVPKPIFNQYTEIKPLMDGTSRGFGRPNWIWHWDFLPQAYRECLRAYIAAASARVYVRTRQWEGDTFRTYQAAAWWPYPEKRDQLGVRVPFEIEFKDGVEQ